MPGISEPLQLSQDPRVLERVAELSRKLRIKPPRVRVIPSIYRHELTGYVEGLMAPMVVISDGIFLRLTEKECDAIIAHELAHIANRSLWILLFTGVIAANFGIGISAFVPWEVSALCALAVSTGLYRYAHRRLEIDCNRRAGRLVGYRETASALRELQIGNNAATASWSSDCLNALETHPQCDVLVADLYRQSGVASTDDFPSFSPQIVSKQLWLSRFVFGIWLATILVTLFAAWGQHFALWAAIPFLAIVVAPSYLRYMLSSKARQYNQWLTGSRRRWYSFSRRFVVTTIVCLLLFTDIWFYRFVEQQLGVPNYLVLFIFLIALNWARSRDEQATELLEKVRFLLRTKEFARILELAAAVPKIVERDPRLRHNIALATDALGDHVRAIEMFESIRREFPNLHLSSFCLAQIYLNAGDANQCLSILNEIQPDPVGVRAAGFFQARAEQRLGQLSEADVTIQKVIDQVPNAGEALALKATIALDRGEIAEARQLVEKALELSPNDEMVQFADAQLALQTESLVVAREKVEKVVAAIRDSVLSGLRYEASQLEAKFAELPD